MNAWVGINAENWGWESWHMIQGAVDRDTVRNKHSYFGLETLVLDYVWQEKNMQIRMWNNSRTDLLPPKNIGSLSFCFSPPFIQL